LTRQADSVRWPFSLEAVFASAADAIILADDADRIVLFNGAAERLLACRASDAIGTPLDRFLTPATESGGLVPARRADGGELVVEARATHAVVDGRSFSVLVIQPAPERGRADLAALDRADDAQARLAALVAYSDDAIVAKNLDGVITDWNPAAERIFGYTAAEAIGRPITMLLPPERQHEEQHIMATLRRGERIDHFDTVRVRKDGTMVDVSVSVSPIKDRTGRVVGAAKIARDVSDRKRADAERERLLEAEQAARAQAETANRAKDDFLSMVSHELRTPLASILGWVSVLRQGKLSAERTAHALNIIESNGKVQAELIEDLLDVSRIITGRLRLAMHPIRLRPIVQAALDVIQPDAAAAGVRLAADLHADPSVAADATRLQQVVLNVLANAVKFTPSGGRVHLTLERLGDDARICVHDTGCGMAPELLPRVFDPFWQAEDVKTRKGRGLGLGLAIVQHLVQLHGGSVSMESPGQGLGATVTLRLPILQDVAVPSASPEDEASTLEGVRVLIVDDDRDTRQALRTMLEDRGALVTTAASAVDARARLAAGGLDVLVSDIRLPEEDGYALIRELRRTGGTLPAVAITAHDDDDGPQQALAAGFHAYFGKPFDPDVLIGTIATLAGRGAH
jgi:PAS domain S-box-containing protein